MTNLLSSSTAAIPTVRPSQTGPIGLLRRLRAQPGGDPAIAGLLGFLVSVAFAWVPSVWFDESATVVSATRSWKQLFAEVQNVDAVHATYYALMHGWFDLVGYTPFTLRLPSALAVGVAAGLLVVLARELTTRRTALVAGLLFVVLPRVTFMATEGRSYATATALVVALTLVFVHASKQTLKNPSRFVRWWLLYGVVALASGAVFLYTVLVVVAHGVTLALWSLRGRRAGRAQAWRSPIGGWLVSSAIVGACLVPLALLSSSQSKQISWISKPDFSTLVSLFTWPWFMQNLPMAVFGWALVTVGIIAVVRRRSRYDAPNVVQIAVPWILVPVVGLIVASTVLSPLYSPRYVAFAAPAVALLMAAGLTSLKFRAVIGAGLIAAIALTAPSYVEQRQTEAKDSSSWSEVAALIAKERALEPSGTTDAIIYGPIRRHPAASARNIAYSYPDAFEGMTDVTLKTPAAETGSLWETRYPLSETIDRVDGHRYVYLVTSNRQDLRPSVTSALKAEGYDVDQEWSLTWVNVVRYER
ncbi:MULTISPECIES: glycosyltransferase family 39 protein [unclassified Frondihabitans]|uniref:glycosyltransferase family 39 protein n=1 Tax=unclassified Frondihabitans TaxID=2626248 RepID=UPI000F4F111A|nr:MULTISPECIES: glycosyltransferase family 39 protein [unclassified Frondihabitans]RPE76177.1 mannosyltransferase [Frondihabitans sp. PhB153]RPF05547.1 mannosyltransferase [Frondihabitans sp. PhB161]